MPNVLNVGSLNIDHVYHLDHIAAPGETLASAGAQVYHSGGVGQVDAVFEHFQSGDFLLLQNEISEIPYLIEETRRRNLQSVSTRPRPHPRYWSIHWIRWMYSSPTERRPKL